MIVEYIRYQMKNHSAQDLVSAYKEAAKFLKAAPECISYELSQCPEDLNSFILRIEWQSAEAHLKGFRGGPLFSGFLQAIRNFIGEITEMRHYEIIDLD